MRTRRAFPARLEPGMAIGVIAPAGPPAPDRLAAGLEALRQAGYHLVPGDHLHDKHGYLAGTDRARAADFTRMFARSDVDAVFCARGGYGSVRLLEHVDWDAVRRHPKLFVGYSDITTLHLALERHAGLVTIHGPMVLTLGGGLSSEARDCFWRAVTLPEPLGTFPGSAGTLVGGHATGHLAGGCLELLAAAVGTPEEPDFAGRIVLIEDVGMPTYRVDRAMCQLARAGLLAQAAGFVIGTVTDWRTSEDGKVAITPDVIWREHLAPLQKPAVVGFRFGHEPDPLTLPLGCRARLDADAGTLTVLEAAVR